MLAPQRHLFDLPEQVAYFNCAYMGPLMHAAITAGEAGGRRKMQPWRISADDFFTESEHARTLFAKVVGASADDIAIVPSASYGIETALANVHLSADTTVVLLSEQFPSNVYPWQAKAARSGASLVTVQSDDPSAMTEAVLAAIDERTRAVALPNCRWNDGVLLDLERIATRCREVGAALVLDVTQSAGVLPLDVTRIAPDFLVSACYKWLLGPYSLGFLYVHPRHHEGRALEQNWITRAGSEDFSGLLDYQDSYQHGARRFDMGERANFHLMPIAITALAQILHWGIAPIAESLRARNEMIETLLTPLGLSFVPASARAGHFLAASFSRSVPNDLLAQLAARDVHLSVRGTRLRITPHVYNTDQDIERLHHALSELLA